MSSVLQDFLQIQGFVLCEYHGAGEFSMLSAAPDWFEWIWGAPDGKKNILRLGDKSAFLEGFLPDAKDFWKAGKAGTLASGSWVETLRDEIGMAHEIALEGSALTIGGKRVLAIRNQAEAFVEKSRVLQAARDALLVHERLQKEIQKKEILLHCIVHDLSQPLTAMRGCFEILALEEGTARARQVVEVGRQQSEQQEEMIREVLKAFSADLQESIASVAASHALPNLLTCAAETVAAFTPTFEAKGRKIRVDPRLAGHPGWMVMGEHTRLKRIFSNLVENALRYTPEGSTVTLGVEEDSPYLKAYVEDQGPGLPEGFQAAEAFKLFARGKDGGGKAGLGLYFCRVTVERWGGTIGCEPAVPRGTRFWFRLLAAKEQGIAPAGDEVAQDALKPKRPPSSLSQGQQKAAAIRPDGGQVAGAQASLRVLLADDDAAIRELTELLLTRQGHKVMAVSTGHDALRLLEKNEFDVVLLDDEMPRLSGSETAKRIRAREKPVGRRQFILSLSGNNSEADQRRMRDAGVDACLSKPFHPEELNRALTQFAVPLAKPPVAAPIVGTADAGGIDADLLRRVGGDKNLLQRMIATFLADYPKKMAELRKALVRHDAEALASVAHALKGSVSIFDLGRPREFAEQLQDLGREGKGQGSGADRPELFSQAGKTFARLEEEIANLEKKLRGYTADQSVTKQPSGQGKGRVRHSRGRTN